MKWSHQKPEKKGKKPVHNPVSYDDARKLQVGLKSSGNFCFLNISLCKHALCVKGFIQLILACSCVAFPLPLQSLDAGAARTVLASFTGL